MLTWPFAETVVADFEYAVTAGGRPRPTCLVAHELTSGRRFRITEFGSAPPYATGPNVLFVAYFASAELSCYRALGWPMPERILDLYVEFRNRTNGLSTPAGSGLLGALTCFGLDGMAAAEKKELQVAIGTGTWRGKFTETEILDYCEQDVVATARLLSAMMGKIDLPRALLRGRYMAAVSAMEHAGVPIDVEMLALLKQHWNAIRLALIDEIDKDFGVYEGKTFKHDRFRDWLAAVGIPWPTLPSGKLDLKDTTFRSQAKAHPLVSPLRELRASLADLRLNSLAVGDDGRNRCLLSPFRASSSRNAPSNSKFIFGPSTWLRGLIKPPEGYGVAYIDWKQQEFGIAAALSGDPLMKEAYLTGDPYLAFGKQAGAVPADATKASHGQQRELFKQCVLAVQYGMKEVGLAARIGQPEIVARKLLRDHRHTYRVFWQWSDANVATALLCGGLHTVFGWQARAGKGANPRSLQNFPMQANGAEMLRLACCYATEQGIEVVAPVHDAVMICAPLDRLEADIAAMREAMAKASRVVLDGFEIGTDVSITRWPDRYMDPRGKVMWDKVIDLVRRQAGKAAA
jgi:hypothetical protein